MRLTLQQLEAHLWGAANILRGKTAGQDYKNYILSLMFYKRLCDQWECEADDAIAELERQQGRAFSDKEKAIFRKRGEHRFKIPDGSSRNCCPLGPEGSQQRLRCEEEMIPDGPSWQLRQGSHRSHPNNPWLHFVSPPASVRACLPGRGICSDGLDVRGK